MASKADDDDRRSFDEVPILKRPTSEESKAAHDEYCKLYADLAKYESECISSIDKWMLALPSAALALTFTTAANLRADSSNALRMVLAASLVSFGCSVIAAMLAKWIAYLSARDNLSILDEAHSIEPLRFHHRFHERSKAKRWIARVHAVNVLCVGCFFLGICSFILFGALRTMERQSNKEGITDVNRNQPERTETIPSSQPQSSATAPDSKSSDSRAIAN